MHLGIEGSAPLNQGSGCFAKCQSGPFVCLHQGSAGAAGGGRQGSAGAAGVTSGFYGCCCICFMPPPLLQPGLATVDKLRTSGRWHLTVSPDPRPAGIPPRTTDEDNHTTVTSLYRDPDSIALDSVTFGTHVSDQLSVWRLLRCPKRKCHCQHGHQRQVHDESPCCSMTLSLTQTSSLPQFLSIRHLNSACFSELLTS